MKSWKCLCDCRILTCLVRRSCRVGWITRWSCGGSTLSGCRKPFAAHTSTTPAKPTGESSLSSALSRQRSTCFSVWIESFLHTFSGLLCLRRFTSQTSPRGTSTGTTWTASAGSATWSSLRYFDLPHNSSYTHFSLFTHLYYFSCLVMFRSHVRTQLCVGNLGKWKTILTKSNRTSLMWRFSAALITVSVTFGTCASLWTSGRRYKVLLAIKWTVNCGLLTREQANDRHGSSFMKRQQSEFLC